MPLDGHLGRALRQGPAGQRPPEEVLRSHGLARPGSVVEIQLQHLVGAAVEGEEALLTARAHDPQYTHLRSLRRPTGAHRLADPQARIENHGNGGVITRFQAGVAGLLLVGAKCQTRVCASRGFSGSGHQGRVETKLVVNADLEVTLLAPVGN